MSARDVRLGVLGPVRAWAPDGAALTLPGPRHREVLARLIAARGQVVPIDTLVADMWDDPPTGAVAAVRTFVAALRRALEPGRAPRSPSRIISTDGTGYRVRTRRADVDAWEFEDAVRAAPDLPWARRIERLEAALAMWRGSAFDGFEEKPWAAGESAALTELRLTAVELLAQARLRGGRPEEAIADLEAHLHNHPGREQAWLLQARALHRAGRDEDALALLRRARHRLAEESGLNPPTRIARLEQEILLAEPTPATPRSPWWDEAASAFADAGPGSVLAASAELLRGLALTGAPGLTSAQTGRATVVDQLESVRDPELTGRILGRLEIPGVWATSDDPARSARIVSAARNSLEQLSPRASPALRARLLALIGIESRGTRGTVGLEAARQSEALARELGDPAILVVALNARFLQSFHSLGGWSERAATADELIAVSHRHDLSTYEILGHLIGMQAASAAGDVAAADRHAAAADRLGERHERDLVGFFTTWYYALRNTLTHQEDSVVEAGYDRAIAALPGSGMPGVSRGVEALTRLCLRLRGNGQLADLSDADFGANAPYVGPLLAHDAGNAENARDLLHAAPAPPPDHLAELRWALLGEAAVRLEDSHTGRAVRRALAPASRELIGAGTGMLSLGPATTLLARIARSN